MGRPTDDGTTVRRYLIQFASILAVGAVLVAMTTQRSVPAETRPVASTRITEIGDAMNAITRIPYAFNERGDLVGRTEINEQEWLDLSTRLSSTVLSARPSEIDKPAIDVVVGQLRDPYTWGTDALRPAVAHIGTQAIEELVQMITTSSEKKIRQQLAIALAEVLSPKNQAAVSVSAIDHIASLLGDADTTVRVYAASSLASRGAQAIGTLPALERALEKTREEEKSLVDYLGPRSTDFIQAAITHIESTRPSGR